MKRILLLFSLLIPFTLTAQNGKLDLDAYLHLTGPERKNADVLVKGDINTIREITSAYSGRFRYSAGDIASVSISPEGLRALSNSPRITRIEARGAKFETMSDSMIYNNNVLPVHAGAAPLTQAYDGTGVVIGIIDTGIDFTHPDFKDSTGNTRIKFLWDQNKPLAANTPQPYNYGQEWDNAAIDSGGAASHTDVANWGHGTHVAGIAAGNGLALNRFKGVAPNADIIFVAMELNNTTNQRIADATEYIYSKAQAMGKPCVINASVGNYIGSHDGNDLEAQMIDNLITAQNGRAFVAASGNAGHIPFHLGYDVTSDTSFTWFNAPSGNNIYIQLWADTAEFRNVQFAVGALDPNYISDRGRTDFSNISQTLGVLGFDTIYNNGNRIGTIMTYGSLNGGTYEMEFLIKRDSAGYFWNLFTTGSGRFDTWNFNMIASGLPPASIFPMMAYYKAPDLQQTMVSSFQCLDNVITVGNYINRNIYTDYNGNTQVVDPSITSGALASNSSKGPTRDGRIKPDITATGANILSTAVLSLAAGFATNAPYLLAEGGMHVIGGGTSAASPVVAGIAALYLQANPNASYADVKQAIISCTKKDQFTGNSLPDNTWGYGKVDAMLTIAGCNITALEEQASNESSLRIFPNPFSDRTVIELAISNEEEAELVIYDATGRAVKSLRAKGSTSLIMQGNELGRGLYFCTLSVNGEITRTEKMVIL